MHIENVYFVVILTGKNQQPSALRVQNFSYNTTVIMTDRKEDLRGSVATKDWVEVQEPPLYKVLLHNDDYTSMEFVVSILENIFQKSQQDAMRIMLNVHEKGIGVAGIYTREICETKIAVVHELARKNEFPLRCSMEKE